MYVRMGKVKIPRHLNCGFCQTYEIYFFLHQYGNPQLQLSGDKDGNLSISIGSAQIKGGRNYK